MTPFGPQPIYRVSQRGQLLADALDMPFSPLKTLWESSQAGFLDSFGAGSIVKDFTIPRSTVPTPDPIAETLKANPLTGGLVQGYEALRYMLGAQPSGKLLSEDEWKASPYYRTEVPWDAGMTEGRAAALASVYDQRTARAFFGEKNPILNFIGGVGGGFADPINFIPVFGPAARTAAIARLGTVRGMALLGASEAAIATAVTGYATQGFRATLGDDVSFEASINNIVFSAIAGTVFGGALGGLSRLAEGRRLLRSTETMRNLNEGRSTVLNDAVQGMVLNGDVELTPNSAGVLRRIADEVNATRDASRALVRETEGITATKAGEVAITPTGRRVEIRPEVVELADLQRATGSLQVRDRTRAASASQIEQIATDLDPARLMPNVSADQGAPIVGPDNVVDSGNGRVSAIGRAYEVYPDKAAAYRKAIEDGYSTEGMVNPVLISRRITPLSDDARAQFNSEANGSSTARMSATELAAMDRAALDDGVLDALGDGPVTASGNRGFVARFLANIPANERTGLVDENGGLNADGVRRIENALIASAYGDVDASVIQRFAEATDDNTRSIVGAMSDVAGKWTVMRRAAKRGDIGPEFDQTPELTDALRMLSRWREQAVREKRPVSVVIKEGMGQLDILDGEIDAATKMFIRAFYKSDDFGSAASRETIAGRLNDLVDVTLDAGQPDMLGDAFAATKMGVLDRAFNLETDLFEAGRLGDGAGALGEAGTGLAARAAGEANPARAQEIGAKYTTADLKAQQPARTIDELYGVAEQHQQALDDIGSILAESHNAEWRNPGVKSKATAAEKMRRKGYKSTAQMTDVVRGGFVVKDPESAEAIVAQLAANFAIADEGWTVTDAGYFDRKVLVRFSDGTVGEVQFWHPDMLEAKDGSGGGHRLYEQMRGLAPDDPKFIELRDQQREIYSSAVKSVDDAWLPLLSRLASELEGGSPTPGNVASNASRVNLRPESTTSAASQRAQSSDGAGLNQAVDPANTAGRSSQSKNVISIPRFNSRVIDMQAPRPEPRPDGIASAAARVGKSEDVKALAEQFGVKENGEFDELADIEQMRADGRLTPEDEAVLAFADQTEKDAGAYAEALRAASACVMR